MTGSQQLDRLLSKLKDWRGKTLSEVRTAILAAHPEISEEWKWMGSPVWCLGGNLVIGNAHKEWVKLTFPKGASLADPDKLFNADLKGKTWRAINFYEGDPVPAAKLKLLVQEAIAAEAQKGASKTKGPASASKKVVEAKAKSKAKKRG
jgi:hypothetical protein